MVIEIASTALFLMSTIYADVDLQNKNYEKEPIEAQVEILEVDRPQTFETYVRSYFEDTPLLAEIAHCESRFRQFDKNGKVIRGEGNRYDVGVMQINELYHQERAEKLGFDIETVEGNLGYAKNLYEKYGSKPWVHSSKCWRKYEHIATANKI